MNKLLLSALCLLPFAAVAQQTSFPETPEQKGLTPSKTELGIHFGLENFDKYQVRRGSVDLSGGVYARQYLTPHWAIVAGLNMSFYTGKRSASFADGHIPGWAENRSYTMNVYAMMQYHFGRPEQRLRPYVGAGTGLRFDHYNDPDAMRGRYTSTALVLRAEAGLSYRISNTISLNTSLYGYRDLEHIRSGLGFQIGVAFRLK